MIRHRRSMNAMTTDYKYAMQVVAEEIAETEYDKDFYDLPQEIQDKVYNMGVDRFTDKMISKVDALLDREKEKQ